MVIRPVAAVFAMICVMAAAPSSAESQPMTSDAATEAGPAAGSEVKGEDADLMERINYVQRVLNEGETYANGWYWGWIGLYSAFVVGSGVLAGAGWDDDADRVNNIVSAAKSMLALTTQFIFPLVSATAPNELEAVPADTDEQRQFKLTEAQRLLGDSRQDVIKKRALLNHIIGFASNAIGSVVIYFYLDSRDEGSSAYKDRLKTSLVSFAVGFAIIEAKIWTTPTRIHDDYAKYEVDYGNVEVSGVEWYLLPGPAGVVAGCTF